MVSLIHAPNRTSSPFTRTGSAVLVLTTTPCAVMSTLVSGGFPGDYMAHLYAMFLLAQFRETRAYPLVVRFASLNPDTTTLGAILFLQPECPYLSGSGSIEIRIDPLELRPSPNRESGR
jgi:hypothetical protein